MVVQWLNVICIVLAHYLHVKCLHKVNMVVSFISSHSAWKNGQKRKVVVHQDSQMVEKIVGVVVEQNLGHVHGVGLENVVD